MEETYGIMKGSELYRKAVNHMKIWEHDAIKAVIGRLENEDKHTSCQKTQKYRKLFIKSEAEKVRKFHQSFP